MLGQLCCLTLIIFAGICEYKNFHARAANVAAKHASVLHLGKLWLLVVRIFFIGPGELVDAQRIVPMIRRSFSTRMVLASSRAPCVGVHFIGRAPVSFLIERLRNAERVVQRDQTSPIVRSDADRR